METLAARITRDGALSATEAVGWTIRLAKRVERIHDAGDVHGAISTAAVLMTEDSPTVGHGALRDPEAAATVMACYSPERIDSGSVSLSDDAWAIASVLYQALTGAAPFSASNDDDLRAKIRAAAPAPLAVFDVGDDELQAIVDRAFARDAGDRFASVHALLEALERWIGRHAEGDLAPLDEDDEPTMAGSVMTMPHDEGDARPPQRTDSEAVARESGEDIETQTRRAPAVDAASGVPGGAPGEASRAASHEADRSSDDDDDDDATIARVPLATLGALRSSARDANTDAPAPPKVSQSDPTQLASPVALKGGPRDDEVTTLAAPHNLEAQEDDDEDVPTRMIASRRQPLSGQREPPRPSARPPSGPPPFNALVSLGMTVPLGTATPLTPNAARPAGADGPAPQQPAPAKPAGQAASRVQPPIAPMPPTGAAAAPPQPAPVGFAPPAAPPAVAPPIAMRAGPIPAPVRAGAPAAPLGPPLRSQPHARNLGWIALASGVTALAIGLAAVLALRHKAPAAEPAAPSASAPPPVALSHAAAPAPAPEPPSASASAAAPQVPAAPVDANACARALFPPDTFQTGAPKFDFVCEQTSPWRGSAAIRGELIRTGSKAHVTQAMRDWAVLGWFEMAAFATVRARCCPSAPPLETPAVAGCAPLGEAATALATAASSAKRADDPAVEDAIAHYASAVRCVVRAGASNRFGDYRPLQGGEDSAYRRVLSAMLGSAAKE